MIKSNGIDCSIGENERSSKHTVIETYGFATGWRSIRRREYECSRI